MSSRGSVERNVREKGTREVGAREDSREGTRARAAPRVGRIKRVSQRVGRKAANMARAAARAQSGDSPWTRSSTYQLGEWFPQDWESRPTELARFMKEKAMPTDVRAETRKQQTYACSVHNYFAALSDAPIPRGAADASQQERKQYLKNKFAQHRKERCSFVLLSNPRERKQSSKDDEWEEINLAVDSGATDRVTPPLGDLLSIEMREGAPYKRGVEYEMANGSFSVILAKNSLWASLQKERRNQWWRRVLMSAKVC